jgi:hypothetical protein
MIRFHSIFSEPASDVQLWPVVHRFQVSAVLDSFAIAMGKMALESPPAKNLVLMHQGLKPPDLAFVINQLIRISEMFQGPILQNSIPAESFPDKTLILEYRTNLCPSKQQI